MQFNSDNVDSIYNACSDVKGSVFELSRSMKFWLFTHLQLTFVWLFVDLVGSLNLIGFLNSDFTYSYFGDGIDLAIDAYIFIFTVVMLAYPNILMDRVAHRFHAIIAHTGCFGGVEDAGHDRLLTCLYLHVDKTAVSVFGLKITLTCSYLPPTYDATAE